VLDEEEANRHFGFSRIAVNPDYSKYTGCLLKHFFLEHYDAPGNSSSDFIRPGIYFWLFGGKNEGLKKRERKESKLTVFSIAILIVI
jgi:hypothetical protein